MNSRLLIFFFLVLISENVFSQIDTIIDPYFEHQVEDEADAESNSIDMDTYFQLKISTDKSLREAKDRINLLEKHAKVKEDSLRDCRNQKNEENLEIDSSNDKLITGKYYALIIAIQDYEHISDLNFPIRDGMNLKEVLDDNYIFESIQLLENPKKVDIMIKLDGLDVLVKADDNLLIFFAGHGGKWDRPQMKDGYRCPADAQHEKTRTLLNNSEIMNSIKLINARNTLLISDACWAGSMRQRSPNPSKSAVKQKLHNTKSRFFMSSGANTTVPDESVFIKYLLKELKNNKKDHLSASDLFYLIKDPTLYNTPRTDGLIVTPEFNAIHNVGHEGGEFFFIKKDK